VFDQHLDAVGIDSDVVYVDTTHGELRDPSTTGGRLVADQIDALVHGRTSMFDDPGTSATLAFDGDRCSFDGGSTATVGQPLRIRLVGDIEVAVWFSMVAFGPDLTDAEMTAIVTAEPRSIDDPPHDPIASSFVLVEPGSEGEMTWVFVNDSLRWSSWCMPEAGSPHPGAGMMYPASEVVLEPVVSSRHVGRYGFVFSRTSNSWTMRAARSARSGICSRSDTRLRQSRSPTDVAPTCNPMPSTTPRIG
jgi:hypothetical protein